MIIIGCVSEDNVKHTMMTYLVLLELASLSVVKYSRSSIPPRVRSLMIVDNAFTECG